MNKREVMIPIIAGLVLGSLLVLSACLPFAEERGEKEDQPPQTSEESFTFTPVPREKIKVELFLMKERKKDAKFIKELLAEQSIKRVLIQFFRAGNPPKNIVIGRGIPADVARMMIELAIHFNNGITHLLPEFRFFPHYVAFGSSAFAIDAQIPITPEDLERLRDDSLSSEEFHRLFRSLTGEDKGEIGYVD
ncbi:MAG: hypothetical protein ACE5HN_09720 [Nitrospiria bacterium]